MIDTFPSSTKRYIESRSLPLGHYERRRAEVIIDSIYEKCSQQENEFSKDLRSTILDKNSVLKLCDNITESLGVRPIRRIILGSLECGKFIPAFYRKRDIHLADRSINVVTLLHEISHHIKYEGDFPGTSHGEGFCEAEQLVFDVVKNIRPQWFNIRSKVC
jgi:hypothetical protein